MECIRLKAAAVAVSLIAVTTPAALADPVSVIVHPSNSATMGADEITRVFLGKSRSFPGGGTAVPIDQAEGSDVRDDFSDSVLDKSASQLKAYWAKLVFTGKGSPPKEVGGDSEVIEVVSSNPNLIGYVRNAPGDGSVRVLMTVD